MKISVIGAGSWGTALGFVLASNGHHVMMHTRNESVQQAISAQHINTRYLPNITLPTLVHATTSIKEALTSADVVLFVVPSHAIRASAKEVKPYLTGSEKIIHATKGFEVESGKRMSEVLHEELACAVSVISGPSHAEEVVKKLPTTVTVASADQETRLFFQNLLKETIQM